MARYTIEDIEILRKKSGITYEEAVNLLEYHNGSLARALVDLEKNGRMKPEGSSAAQSGHKVKSVFQYLFRLRIKVSKQSVGIINLSSLFMLLVLLTAPHILIVGVIVALVLGYKIGFEQNAKDFSFNSFDELVRNARDNVQNTVNSFTKSREGEQAQEKPTAPRNDSAPSGTTPVNVQFPGGGSVNVREDADGYHEADIQ